MCYKLPETVEKIVEPPFTFPKFHNSNFNNKNGLYNCRICNTKGFKNYDEIQDHFIKEHYIIKDEEKNKNFPNNKTITKSYLDNKLNNFKNEVKNIILN